MSRWSAEKVPELEGTWWLVPELSIYEDGVSPASAMYRMSFDGDEVRICIDWETAQGEAHSLDFGGRCDGVRRRSTQPGVAEVSFSLIDARTLDSTAFGEDSSELAYARRQSSSDGKLLVTLQRTRRENDTTYSNFQVYRRGT